MQTHLQEQHNGNQAALSLYMCLMTGNNQLGQLPTSSQLTEAQVSVFSASGMTQSATDNSTGTSVNNRSIPGEMYQHPQGTAETTVAYF